MILNQFFFSREEHIPAKRMHTLSSVIIDLLDFAFKNLVHGGRLVYWLPVFKPRFGELFMSYFSLWGLQGGHYDTMVSLQQQVRCMAVLVRSCMCFQLYKNIRNKGNYIFVICSEVSFSMHTDISFWIFSNISFRQLIKYYVRILNIIL